MIRLKRGKEIPYNQDVDAFLHNLSEALIRESFAHVKSHFGSDDSGAFQDHVLREIMDNCIYVTHQVFEIAKIDEQFAQFLTAGFLFNNTILFYERFRKDFENPGTKDPGAQIH